MDVSSDFAKLLVTINLASCAWSSGMLALFAKFYVDGAQAGRNSKFLRRYRAAGSISAALFGIGLILACWLVVALIPETGQTAITIPPPWLLLMALNMLLLIILVSIITSEFWRHGD